MQDADAAAAAEPPLATLIAAATAEQTALLALNDRLQRHIRSVLDLRTKANAAENDQLGTADARYASLRARLQEHRAMLAATDKRFDVAVDELRDALQTRLGKATSVQNVRSHLPHWWCHCSGNVWQTTHAHERALVPHWWRHCW